MKNISVLYIITLISKDCHEQLVGSLGLLNVKIKLMTALQTHTITDDVISVNQITSEATFLVHLSVEFS